MQVDMIRVVLVDDHEMVRRGLAVFLAACDDIRLVGEASDGEEALQVCQKLKPDVVLMDLMMPGMGGLEAIKALRTEQPGVQIVAMTSFTEERLVVDALQNGAIGYVLKNATIDEIAATIRAAYNGQPRLAPEATRLLIRAATQPERPQFELTEREREVLAWLAQGLSNRKIAEKLTLSPATVKTHVSNILAKLNAGSRAEAVSIAHKHKLV